MEEHPLDAMSGDLERLAQALAGAWRAGATVALPPEGLVSRAEAYWVQDRMAALIGGAVAGWKVGATVRAVQIFEGHDGPLPGRIFADRCFAAPAAVPSGLVPAAKVECEFALRVTADFPAGGGPVDAAALSAAAVFHPAVEIAGSRYAPGTGGRAAATFDGIADNGSGGAAVLGAAVADWRGLGFETMAIDARIDDSPAIQAYGGAYRRHPLDILVETVADLHGRGIDVVAGAVFLTGSLTLPTPIRHGQVMVVRFADLPPLSLSLV